MHCYIYQRQHSFVHLEILIKERGFPGGSDVKNPPAMQETWVQPLGGEDPLEKEMATHSSILGLHWWLSWQGICLQCGRPGFDPWVRKIPWRREWQPTPVFWPGELPQIEKPGGLYSPWGRRVRHDLVIKPPLRKGEHK